LKLPTLNNYLECSDKYTEYRQDTVNRRSVHERIGRIHPSDGRRVKIMKLMITQEKDMLIKSGLIMKSRSMNMSDRKDNGAHLD
jgi:hypothetical protein